MVLYVLSRIRHLLEGVFVNDAPSRPRLADAPTGLSRRAAIGWRTGLIALFIASFAQTGSLRLLIGVAPLVAQLTAVIVLRWKWRAANTLAPIQRLKTAVYCLVSQAVPMVIGLVAWILPGHRYGADGYLLLLWSGLVLVCSLAGCNFATWRLLRLAHDLDPASRSQRKLAVTVTWLGSLIAFMAVHDRTVPLWIKLLLLPVMLLTGLLTVRFWDTTKQPSAPKEPTQTMRFVDLAVATYFWLLVPGVVALWLTLSI